LVVSPRQKTRRITRKNMKKTFKEKLKTDLILLDGAFGTYAEELGLSKADFKDKPGCMEYLSFSKPDLIERIHSDYLSAGSDAVETNTFGANSIKLSEYGMENKVYEINVESTRLARKIADRFSSLARRRYVIGSMGPTGKLPSSGDENLGNISYSELVKVFYDQTLGLIDGGADALLVETGQDLLEIKAAVRGIKEALKEKRKDLAIMAEWTLSNNGRMLLGTRSSACMAVLGHLSLDVIGINCSTGPKEMEDAIKFLSENSPVYFSAVPNAGLPISREGKTVYPLEPREMAEIIARFVRKYGVDVVGGCCGTTPEHIKAMRSAIGTHRKQTRAVKHFYAGFYKGFDIGKMERPLKIGERVNAQGSRKVKDLLRQEKYDEIIELGKLQEKQGAGMLDVCVVLSERATEKRDSVLITRRLGRNVEIPLMIDSTDADVIKAALESYPGTAFINSVNLEDGGIKARGVFALAAEHAGFVVNLVIDEKGMAKSVERKIEIAERLYRLATEEYLLEPHRLLFDMLTFTLGTGEKEYALSAVNTYKSITLLKKRFPGVLTVLGVSNVSFGLKKDMRKIINMVFLHHAARAGLDMAIVNPAEYIEYKDINKKERVLAEKLIFNKHPKALHDLIEYFERVPRKKTKNILSLTNEKTEKNSNIEQKLKNCVLERDKVKIIPLIDECLKEYSPREIMSDILIDAMRIVGEKLENGEMVLPYVLESAEVMKKAIDYLEQSFGETRTGDKGKILLATVFGDVHDIGKNLVKMILQNNGFSVIDLGKQVPVEEIVRQAKKNKVDAVGLSALLVSTSRYMKDCVRALHAEGLKCPVLIGGAPVNEEFSREISKINNEENYAGGVFYAKDAFKGLSILQAIMDDQKPVS